MRQLSSVNWRIVTCAAAMTFVAAATEPGRAYTCPEIDHTLARARERFTLSAWGRATRGVTTPEFVEELRGTFAADDAGG